MSGVLLWRLALVPITIAIWHWLHADDEPPEWWWDEVCPNCGHSAVSHCTRCGTTWDGDA